MIMNPMAMLDHLMMMMKPRPNSYRRPKPSYKRPNKAPRPPQQPTYHAAPSASPMDYSGWQPIGGSYGTPEPVYSAPETPIVTIEDAYNSPVVTNPLPPLPSDGYAPEPITAAPSIAQDSYGVQVEPIAPPVQTAIADVDSYGAPQAAPVSYNSPQANEVSYDAPPPVPAAPQQPTYGQQPEQDSYGIPQAAPIASYEQPQPVASSYTQPQPAYTEPDQDSYGVPAAPVVAESDDQQDSYGTPQAPPVSYVEPEPAQESYGTPEAAPVSYDAPKEEESSPVESYSAPQATVAPAPSYVQPAYEEPIQPAYEEPVQPAYEEPAQPTYEEPAQPTYDEDLPSYQPVSAQYTAAAPIEEPLFEYAPVSDLNSLAAAEDIPAPASDSYSQPQYNSPAPGQYQATVDAASLAQEVGSGSVYVQPRDNAAAPETNYVYNQPQYTNEIPVYGSQVPASQVSSLNVYGSPAPPAYGAGFQASPLEANRGASSASFSIHVNGKSHGFSHDVDHKL